MTVLATYGTHDHLEKEIARCTIWSGYDFIEQVNSMNNYFFSDDTMAFHGTRPNSVKVLGRGKENEYYIRLRANIGENEYGYMQKAYLVYRFDFFVTEPDENGYSRMRAKSEKVAGYFNSISAANNSVKSLLV